MNSMNTYFFEKINFLAGHNIWLDRFMIFSADWLGYLMILGLAIFLTKDWRKWRGMFLVSVGSAIIARFGFVTFIRWFYYHPRPFMVLQDINQLVDHETTSSFPSGHTSFYFALATGLYIYNKKAGRTYLILAGLMGFARIFVGVHWPLDIVAGAVLGIVVAMAGKFLYKKYSPKV